MRHIFLRVRLKSHILAISGGIYVPETYFSIKGHMSGFFWVMLILDPLTTRNMVFTFYMYEPIAIC